MSLPAVLVALGSLSLGAALSQVLAQSSPTQLAFLFDWPAAVALAVAVMGLVLLGWWQLGCRLARQTDQSLTHVLVQDAPAHVPLLLSLPYALFHRHTNLAVGWTLIGGGLALMLTLRVHQFSKLGLLPRDWANRGFYIALFALPLALYLRTLTPSVGTKDGFELQVVSATLGIAHPTGYPLFTLLGRLFIALVPIGSPAYRINFMCALFAALSIPLIYAIGCHVLKRRAPAALAALTFAFTPTFWTQASIPEKYTLNICFVALVIYLAVRWAQKKEDHRAQWLYWLSFVYGLSLTHHRTMLLLAPGLVLYVLLTEPSLLRQPKRLLITLGLFAAPQLLYLYIPWRAYAQGWQMTWPEFWSHISGSEYAPALRLDEWLTSPERRATYLRFLRDQFGHLGIGLGIVGWLSLLRRRWRAALFSLATWAVYVAFSIGYHAYYNDVNYFLPSHLIFALWIGAGMNALAGGLAVLVRRLPISPHLLPWGAVGFWTVAALLPLHLISTHLPGVDMSQAWNDLPWAEHVLSLDLPPKATVLADSVKVAPLHYLTTVEKVRPDVKVVVLPDETAYIQSLETHLTQGLPIYLARYLPNLGGAYHLRSLGPLVEVSLSPLIEPPASTQPLEATFGDGIQLLGYDASPLTAPRQGQLHITLYWQPEAPVPESYQPRLRLLDFNGHVWWKEEGRLPVNDHYPTNAWRPGEVIPDYHEVPIEPTLQPGDYLLELGLFRPFAISGLPVHGDQGDHVALGTVTVTSAWEGKPPRPVVARRDRVAPNLILVGVDVPEQGRPGGQARLRLHWQVLGSLPNYEFALTLRGETQSMLLSESFWPKEYATSTWPTGETIVTQHIIDLPADLAGQPSIISLSPGLQGNLPSLPLAKLRIEGAPVTGQEIAVNFDNQILLLDYDIPRKELSPGDLFEMTVNWQGLVTMDENYTVFVHLLGPDGVSHGQADVWPHDGTYPTSTWPVGEVIVDSYRVPLDTDAPLGVYQVEVGVYLLRTMGRLPVLNTDGRPIDDKLLIEALNVRK